MWIIEEHSLLQKLGAIYAFYVLCIFQEIIISDGCTLPTSLQGGWKYNYTNTMVTFGASTMAGPAYTAKGVTLRDYSCISNSGNVYVMKSDDTYTDKGQDRRIYLCMKLTEISDNLYYFYLLGDVDTVVVPNDRVYNPPGGSLPPDDDPTCDYCTYLTPPPNSDIRTLQKTGTSESLTGNEELCLPCDAICYNNDTESTTSKVITSVDTTTSPACRLPDDLVGTWTDVTKSENVTFTSTHLTDWPALLTGKTLYNHTCISSLRNVYVFRGDEKYEDLGDLRHYFFCMKLTKVSTNLFYYYLLSDINNQMADGERIYTPNPVPDSSTTATCDYCLYTTDPPDNDYRELRKIGSTETLNTTPAPCLPCSANCDVTTTSPQTTEMSTTTAAMTPSTQTTNSEITTSQIPSEYSTNGGTTKSGNPACTLPVDLVGLWTDVNINETVSFTYKQLIEWPVTLTGKTYYNHTCISNTRNVFVFKGNEQYEEIGSYKSYFFCMKLTHVSTGLFYFYLLGDKNGRASQERIYTPDTEPDSSTTTTCDYCSYTTDIPNDDYRELRQIGSSKVLNSTPQPCLPCSATCDVTTEETTTSTIAPVTTDNTAGTLITSTTTTVTIAPSDTDSTTTLGYTSATISKPTTTFKSEETSTTKLDTSSTTLSETTTGLSTFFVTSSTAISDSTSITSPETTLESTSTTTSKTTPTPETTSETTLNPSTATTSESTATSPLISDAFSTTTSKSISTTKSVSIATTTSDTTSTTTLGFTATTTSETTSTPPSTSDLKSTTTSAKLSSSDTTSPTASATTTKHSKSNQLGANSGTDSETGLTDSAILLIVSSSVSGIFLGLSFITLSLCLMRKKIQKTLKPARHRHVDFSLTRRYRNRTDIDYSCPIP